MQGKNTRESTVYAYSMSILSLFLTLQRQRMFPSEHLNRDTKEPANGRHVLFS